MKIYIDRDERYPHFFFYADEEMHWGKPVEVSDELLEKMVRIRDEELWLQDQLELLSK